MKSAIRLAALASIATFSLTACGSEPEATETAAPDGVPGVSVENARLILPAVAGNPAAVYFDLSMDDTGSATAVRAASVADAGSAQVHQTMEYGGEMVMNEAGPEALRPGETLSFSPGGLHVMAFDLAEGLAVGDTTEVTLTVVGGDKFSFPAEVRDIASEDAATAAE